ncbi:MAG TPA: sugar phosphate isomerase/epimerase [Gemmatimonadales bacterium]|nr:sugar phosphate isomerase/epimerase [Gemmatimonadales bacterium]
MDRRSFVGAMAAMAPVAALSRRFPVADSLDRIGLQLYTVRSEMATSVERTLHQVAQIGYKEVEFAGYFNRPARAIRQLLDRNGLKSPSAHVSLDVLRGGWHRTLSEAEAIGQKWLVVPSLAESDRNSMDALKRTAEVMNRAGLDARTYKIRVGYHNHDVEFREVEGKRILDVLLDETDPEYVDFEMDLYWITKAGGDPFDYFRRYPERFPLLHVKDSGGAPDHQMTEVGKGTIDFAAIFRAARQGGFKHYYVEHDNPADPMSSARTSYRYLDSLQF